MMAFIVYLKPVALNFLLRIAVEIEYPNILFTHLTNIMNQYKMFSQYKNLLVLR